MKIYLVKRTAFDKINKTVESEIEYAFKTEEKAKQYLENIVEKDSRYRVSASKKNIMKETTYMEFYREIIEVDLI